jgi:two-component system, OmpR family, response regulator BaeR
MSLHSETTTVLVVEDEPKLARLIIDYLEGDQLKAVWLQDDSMIQSHIEHHKPSIIILDITLPGTDSHSVCKGIRKFCHVPIIILTAGNQETDRLRGFEVGADDCICKPFSPRELVLRVKAILRRVPPIKNRPNVGPELSIDYAGFSVRLNGVSLELTPIEFGVLAALTKHPGRVFSRSELLDKAYSGHHVINDRTIDCHIKNLRRKLKSAAPDQNIVQSIYGLGYKAELPNSMHLTR